ncbi:splicing factor Prp18 family protein [Actinidia rufa]|uniref:Pre-mRNA-splicing factor 18 n=1 Tax=Actinidia rufa TaxID=165716 RepID=A0A7J0H9Q7_9ERIC|nr:splicing factor Prp18 family protein [Actinidia rufa]
MDILKQELLKKRQSLAQDVGGRKFFKRSEIEQKRIQRLREEEKRESEAKAQKQQRQDHRHHESSPNSSSNPNSNSEIVKSKPDSTGSSSSKTLTDEQKIDDLNLPKQEVIRRLRLLKQPVTLFGEDDEARLDRLKYVLKAGSFEVDDSDMTEGQTNDFLRDIVELKKRQKSGILSDRKRKTDLKRMKANFEDLCDEDKILVFFKRLLNEWKQELDEMSEAEKRTAKGKSIVATFKQCARYLNPLFKFCRKKVLVNLMHFVL